LNVFSLQDSAENRIAQMLNRSSSTGMPLATKQQVGFCIANSDDRFCWINDVTSDGTVC